jgi:hypothetical protein
MLNYNRYLIFSGIVVGVLLILVAAFNYIVDPYNLLGNNRTGVYFWNERQIKDSILTYDHQAVLMGSSKTGYVNPDGLSCYRFYNASIRGAVPEEMFFYLKKYLRNEKLVLIGFDFYMFNEREFPLIKISDWNDVRYTLAEYLFGVHTVEASFKTLQKWKNREPIIGMKANGQFAYPGSTQAASADDAPQYKKKYNDIIKGVAKHHYGSFSFSGRRMAYVREIKKLLEEKGIPYAVFINPENLDVYDALQQLEAYSLFVSWKQEMKTIFPDIYDYSVSRYSARDGFYRDDPYHYTNATGKAFLNEIINDLYPSGSPP